MSKEATAPTHAPAHTWTWHRGQAAAELERSLKALRAGNLSQAWSSAAQAEFHLSHAVKDRPYGAGPLTPATQKET